MSRWSRSKSVSAPARSALPWVAILPVTLVLAAFSCITPGASARTWQVYADGSGDAPTIQAAFDLASVGDEVLVGPGTYHEHDILSKAYVSLHSVAGPERTIVDASGGSDGLIGNEYNAPWDVSGFTFRGASLGGISIYGGGGQMISHCIFRECGAGIYGRYFNGVIVNVTSVGGVGDRPSGSGFSFSYSEPLLQNCISAFNQGYGIVCWTYSPDLRLECCCVYGNPGGDFSGLSDPTGTDGNISLDPLFCGFTDWDLRLTAGSPCAPDNPQNPECDLIGALGVGCGPTPVHQVSWGSLKTLFLP